MGEYEKQLLPAQDDFVFSTAKAPAIVGGLGSGKTEGGVCRLMRLALEDRVIGDGGQISGAVDTAYYMPTYDLLELRAMVGFEEFMDNAKISYKTNQSKYFIDIEGYGRIIFRSYDKPKRIIGYEVAHSIVDELDTLKKEDAKFVWRKISERNRQKSIIPNSIGCVTTPDMGYNGFIYEKWYKLQQQGYEIIEASTYDNPFLPDGYIQQILDNYDPILADLYLRGKIVSLTQNKPYHFFNRIKHYTDKTIADSTHLHIGLDFNVGGTCATVFIIVDNKPHAVDEFVSYDTFDFVNNLTRYKDHRLYIYPDASGDNRKTNATQTDINIIKQAGYTVIVDEANPAVRDRINSINGLLSHDKLFVNTDKCPNLTNALETQGYDKKGEPEKFDVHPAIDDWNDSLGYFIVKKFPIRRTDYSKIYS